MTGQEPAAPVLDVVVPVHNEQHTVGACVRRLHAHLVQTFPYPFRITVADNASTDGTAEVARGLVAGLPGVALVELEQKGRGRALKQVWLASDAPILAYMDVDLSTDLDALWPLVAPLMSGHSDLAIGSRLARGARVVRGVKREVISRCYNLVLRGALGARFSDAQCGFKAIRADVAAELLPMVQDPTWFFDTELLVLAERSGLRIHEVPVDWYDDPDSRVDVVATALDDLRGVRRVRRDLRRGVLPVADVARRMGRFPVAGPAGAVGGGGAGDGGSADDGTGAAGTAVGGPLGAAVGGTWQQARRFAAVGLLCTVLHLGLFAALVHPVGSTQTANLVALLLATLVNTGLNRRWTFGVQGPGRLRHQAQGLVVFGLTWAMTAGALGLLHLVDAQPSTTVATAVLGVATGLSTLVRFVAMRSWMFRPAGITAPPGEALPSPGAAEALGTRTTAPALRH
ncbi:bifunctional glycosyltransferase family 2/GtrA family protein [Phycicoccus sp. M110.8]|uniref:bifunctional glycosyltransferase family 2/GtrA family protein n=1 Tax=Phycicoccus sp. M110.8 TaxID=3075433 RepID=UPI0028FDAC08|nr:bifunctional glycosyltransferase family 2/GtrA family protein [Phycicoccus sp. M110.8]MDU0313897.1 bifunctional glycosyltransferase family 2/GtrA family protein [Phycicoccus sp. M110.8]